VLTTTLIRDLEMYISYGYWVNIYKGGWFYMGFPTTQISGSPDPALDGPVTSEFEIAGLFKELSASQLAFVVLPPDYRHLVHLFMTTPSDPDDLDLSILCYRNLEHEEPVADDWLGVRFHWQRSLDSQFLMEIKLSKVALMGIQATENQTFTAHFWLSGNTEKVLHGAPGVLGL
jgi:hypothetical protein